MKGATRPTKTVGLIPAAGHARRLPLLEGSKEVLPLPGGGPAAGAALEAFYRAGVLDVVLVLRPEKTDIRRVLGSGAAWGVRIQYMETDSTRGPAETLDRAYPLIRGADVALAFPDLLMESEDPYSPLLAALHATSASGALGLYPRTLVQPADPVDVTADGSVSRVYPKNHISSSPWCWGTAVWSARLTEYLHVWVERASSRAPGGVSDLGVGLFLNEAVRDGYPVTSLPVDQRPFLDIGTPEGLAWAQEGRRSPPNASHGGSKGPGQNSD